MTRKLVFVLLFVGLLLPIAGAVYTVKRATEPVVLSQISQVSQTVKLKFPPQAVLLEGEKGGGLSPYVIAKIRMPRASVTPFLAQTPLNGRFDNAALDDDTLALMTRKGWRPNAARHIVSVSGVALTPLTNASDGVWLSIDLDEPQSAILYLYYQS